MNVPTMLRVARLVSGLVLMAFVAGHLLNLSLGLQSLATMEAWRKTLMQPWQTRLGETLLLLSMLVHIMLGLHALAVRRTLVLSRTDWVQLLLGLATPPLLIGHILSMRVAGDLIEGFSADYGFILSVYWSLAPTFAFQQIIVVVIVWIHASLGLYSWLVLKPVWSRIKVVVLPALFLVPIVALLGFAEAGKEVLAKLATNAEWQAQIMRRAALLASVQDRLMAIQRQVVVVFAILVLIAATILALRMMRNRNRLATVSYDEGFSAAGRFGLSILEISRLNNVPHAHVCSGRGSCGTCRVRVDAGDENLSPPGERELRTLRQGLGRSQEHADVRLACQALVLKGHVSVVRLMPAYVDAAAARAPDEWTEPMSAAPGSEPILPDAAGAPA
ncbi:MAG: (2Fe-2S)-binding protein [Beijerinckiaceae bacterium]|nr:(2Fe-2S)-binding protein [Beijerinckiaceae bacterium]